MAIRMCQYPGCSGIVGPGQGGYCKSHERLKKRPAERERCRLYDRRLWRKERKTFLVYNPLCVHCLERGLTVPATEVHHVEPHEGNEDKFFDVSNWMALCKPCHSVKTAKDKAQGR